LSERYERHVALENALNFRDVGGYETSSGGRLRWRMLFRAASLSELSAADVATLRALGLTTVIDLRSRDEVESDRFPVSELPVGFHHLPLVEQAIDPSRQEVTTGRLVERYCEIAELGTPSIARAFALLAERETYPAVVHCLAGKDRTGILIALVLSVLGVSDQTVFADYALSAAAMAVFKERRARPGLTDSEDNELFSALPGTMAGLFERLRADHGSAEAFVRHTGVTAAQIERLREALVDQPA
jgi:protein-tyrosine phosphatase